MLQNILTVAGDPGDEVRNNTLLPPPPPLATSAALLAGLLGTHIITLPADDRLLSTASS